MRLQQIYAWARKIHKFLLWFVTILGLWMMFSGYILNQELEGNKLLSNELRLFVRVWHNKVSQYFLVVLLAQIVTGILMWGIPKILEARTKPPVQ